MAWHYNGSPLNYLLANLRGNPAITPFKNGSSWT